MSKLRFRVVESAFEKKATELTTPAERPSEYYGELVFNRSRPVATRLGILPPLLLS